MRPEEYFDIIKSHYVRNWHSEPQIYLWDKGPIEHLNFDFRVLEFAPTDNRKMWSYATCCMSQLQDDFPIELHIYSDKQDPGIIELLFMAAHFHKNRAQLGLYHTLNLGRSWQDVSSCDHGFISLPYLDGAALELLKIENIEVSFYWLISVTEKEVRYKQKHGVEALEKKFEERSLNYINPSRDSVV